MTLLGRLIVYAAPSGSGKTTVVQHVLSVFPDLAFSVSATTRARRDGEEDGRDYYFFDVDHFKMLIESGEFAEWEEVYPGQYYGTLKAEINRLREAGRHVVFDVDVKGAMSIKRLYPDETLTVFIKVPSMEVLEQRLRTRGTDTEESLQKRLSKAAEELEFEPLFDVVLVNDVLEDTLCEAEDIVRNFLF